MPEKAYQSLVPDRLPREIVWIAQAGPGGGGGGGNRNPEPPRQKEATPVTVPDVRPPDPTPVPQIPVLEPPALVPDELLATAPDTGASVAPGPSDSRGRGNGAGTGPANGPGFGPGGDGGVGGGPVRPGNGVESPVPIRQVRPSYTADAMRARTQGSIDLDCVVLPDGNVGMCDVVRSMKPPFGLDAEAIKAAQQWRFRPGRRLGEPVAVLVRIELTFTLR
jgi:protein TonB